MLNSVLVHNYPRTEGLDIVVIDSTGRQLDMKSETTSMGLFAANGAMVLEVIRYRGEEPVGTIHLSAPTSIELIGRAKTPVPQEPQKPQKTKKPQKN